jgi:hypothetical protein
MVTRLDRYEQVVQKAIWTPSLDSSHRDGQDSCMDHPIQTPDERDMASRRPICWAMQFNLVHGRFDRPTLPNPS